MKRTIQKYVKYFYVLDMLLNNKAEKSRGDQQKVSESAYMLCVSVNHQC